MTSLHVCVCIVEHVKNNTCFPDSDLKLQAVFKYGLLRGFLYLKPGNVVTVVKIKYFETLIRVFTYLHCRTWTRISIRLQISIPKMGTVVIRIGIRIQSPCNMNMFCIVQCSYLFWNPNPSPYLNPGPAM